MSNIILSKPKLLVQKKQKGVIMGRFISCIIPISEIEYKLLQTLALKNFKL